MWDFFHLPPHEFLLYFSPLFKTAIFFKTWTNYLNKSAQHLFITCLSLKQMLFFFENLPDFVYIIGLEPLHLQFWSLCRMTGYYLKENNNFPPWHHLFSLPCMFGPPTSSPCQVVSINLAWIKYWYLHYNYCTDWVNIAHSLYLIILCKNSP